MPFDGLRFPKIRPLLVILGLALVAVLPAVLVGTRSDACSPFPPMMLVAQEGAVLAAPVVPLSDALAEMGVIEPPEPLRSAPDKPAVRTADADRKEVHEVLIALDVPVAERERLVRAHGRFRAAVVRYLEAVRDWERRTAYWRPTGPPPPPPTAHLPPIPEALPTEFELYLRGAAAYHRERFDEARKAWKTLLELPAKDRRHRSVWAAYMLGRTALDEDPETAERWFLRARQLAAQGFTDVLDLAHDALGWLGRIELDRERPARALGLYARQAADGRDRGAILSLSRAADRLARAGPEQLAEAAADPFARRAFTAYLIAHPNALGRRAPDWPRLSREAGEEPFPEATLRAREAYGSGRFDDARRWLEAAPAEDPMALWLRGKLLVREGELDRAAETLRRAATGLPKETVGNWNQWATEWVERHPRAVAAEARAEAALVELSRGRFEEALDLFVRVGARGDAAYVAERVLTAEELQSWIDREAPIFGGDPRNPGPLPLESRLRWLLARRLVRLDRIDEALPYFVPIRRWGSRATVTALARRLRDALICGRGEAEGNECHGGDRADGYWQAALLTRYNGAALRGTELGPDWWFAYQGALDLGSVEAWFGPRREFRFLPATEEEIERLHRHGPEPPERWHYRHAAADLAWEAARLLPDGSERKATILATAGTWLKHRDPEAADRFYKALVHCCRNTELGRQADERRWFPPVESPIPSRRRP